MEHSFYVDNWLQSFPDTDEAKRLADKMLHLLAEGGFEFRQWASNTPAVISHLPREARSDSSELWFTQTGASPQERTLGMQWHCLTDTLGYKQSHIEDVEPTMHNIYRTLATQYDPLGFIIPYTTRAKILVQRLWDKARQWDDPQLPEDLLQAWRQWVNELLDLSAITLPRCYVTPEMDLPNCSRSIHVFCDASERAYGSVAYLRTTSRKGDVQVSFLAARSGDSPKKAAIDAEIGALRCPDRGTTGHHTQKRAHPGDQ